MIELAQPQLLAPIPPVGRFLTFRIAPEADVRAALTQLRDDFAPDCGVAGIGEPAILALGAQVPGLRTFPALSGPATSVPSTQQALMFFLRGPDRGILFDATQKIREIVGEAFILEDVNDTFTYHGGRDLTRFEDGTENPCDEKAVAAAIVADGESMRGSSFVAVQRWVHDLGRFHGFSGERRNQLIGRDADTNDELEDPPPFAHIKRAEQEAYDPPAFMVRRSMPWAGAEREGLEFVAFVESLDRYERVLRRMTGCDDGIIDGLFRFSRPITGGYYWCPPVRDGKLNLTQLGI
ncbi:MAG: Dyp-type peroxidase [Acidobacteria bacterium]|nr:Dyp-type peroxidase [Acidobacteriota bacterium]MBV9479114.1 Dyp-type peroxidase [Acidobacteriota bacterium]